MENAQDGSQEPARVHRLFAISIVAGVLLLAASPVLQHYNSRALDVREDTGSGSHFMRQDLACASAVSGVALSIGGLYGMRATQVTKRRATKVREAFLALPILLFAAVNLAQIALILPFFSFIYSIDGRHGLGEPISFENYTMLRSWTAGLAGVLCLMVVTGLSIPGHALLRRIEAFVNKRRHLPV